MLKSVQTSKLAAFGAKEPVLDVSWYVVLSLEHAFIMRKVQELSSFNA